MKLIDITDQNQPTVIMLKNNTGANEVKIYEHKGTRFIFTHSTFTKYVSISNPYRKVKKSEITYSIKKFLGSMQPKESYISTNGVIHLKI